jgi:WD40 repeat protein
MVVAVTEMTDKVRVFDTATGKMIWERQPASRIALAPDGKMAAFLDRDDKLVLWDLAENRQLRNWKAHDQNPGQTYQFSPDGKTLASTAMRRDIRFWDVASGKMISEIKGAWGSHLRFSPDGRAILYCWEDAIHLRDVKSGAEIRRFVGHGSWIAHAAFSRNGKHLITGSRDHTTILWDVATGKELHDFQGHRGAVNAIAFSPKGDLFASGGGDHALIVWDLAKHRPRHIFSDHDIDVNSLAFHPDGVRVATGDGSFGHTDREAYLRIWDIEKGKLERKFFAHMGMVGSVHYVADGKQLVSAGADRRIRVWDADTGNRLHQFRTPDLTSRLVLSRDRKTLMQFGLTVGASSRWDIATWKELPIGELEDFPSAISRHDRNVMAYSPDGALRAFCPVDFRDFAISLHDNKTGKLICKLLGHTSFVNSLAFSPDSRTLASGSADTTILLWDVAAIKK